MIRSSFLNASSGISKKTGAPWYRIMTLVMVSETQAVPFEFFCEEAIFAKVSNCKARQNIGLKCGVNSFGKLCIVDVMVE